MSFLNSKRNTILKQLVKPIKWWCADGDIVKNDWVDPPGKPVMSEKQILITLKDPFLLSMKRSNLKTLDLII